MGVERAVTRWYVQRQVILEEISTLDAKLAKDEKPDQQEIRSEWAKAKEKLLALGPCPKPMMG